MLAHQRRAAVAKETAKHERDDDGVIELARDGNEVRNEVERKREVAGQRDEQDLLAARYPRVTEKPAAKNNAVGNEAGERAGAFAPAGDGESENENAVREDADADGDE